MRRFSFTINGNEYNVRVHKIEGDKAEIEVNGTPYAVKLNHEIKTSKTPVVLVRKEINTRMGDDRVKENLSPIAENKKPSSKNIKSPLPGSIIKVNVAVNDHVKEGDVLLVMESMKMENNILAERSGRITKVCIQPGFAVLQDEVLFEIE